VVRLTATVTAGTTALTTGQVNFCDATATYCTDIHLLGSAQLTSGGTATLKFRPGIGSHSYKAVFLGTNTYAGSSSSAAALAVTGTTGPFASATMVAQTGSWGNYSLTATVTESGGTVSPTGSVSFLDTSYGNALLGSAALGPSVAGWTWVESNTPTLGFNPYTVAVGDFNGDGIPDVAVANPGGGTVTILLGKGDGTFTVGASVPAGPSPMSVSVGDFNGDGKEDLVVADYPAANTNGMYNDGVVWVLL
jgi:hypothetical protein